MRPSKYMAFALLFSKLVSASDHQTAPTHGEATAAQSSWKTFMQLQEGNKRFAAGRPTHPKQNSAARKELVNGQKPHTIVLSCSDSRVPPEVVFDQGLGEVFTVRVAGEVLDAAGVASIEYALEHLGAKMLVVLGHESCGAVKAALTTPDGQTAGSPDLDKLVAGIKPHLNEYIDNPLYSGRALASATDSSQKLLRDPVKANVRGVVKDLMARSKIVRERVASHELMVAQGIYTLEKGEVEFWDAGH